MTEKPILHPMQFRLLEYEKKLKVYWVQLPKITCFSVKMRFFGGVSKQNRQTVGDVTKCHGLEAYLWIGKYTSFNLELFRPYGSIWNYGNCALKVCT